MEKEEIKADGHSLCYMFVEAVDDDGILCPASEDEINVTVTGDAILQGVGTARAYSDSSFGDVRQKLFRGRCQIVLKSKEQAGEAIVAITSENGEQVKGKLKIV